MPRSSDPRCRWLKRALGGALLAALSLGAAPVATAIETVSISSLDGKLALPGYWFPAEATAPRPAVVLLHGCDGTLDEHGQLCRNAKVTCWLYAVDDRVVWSADPAARVEPH